MITRKKNKMIKTKNFKTPYRNVKDFERENSNLISVKEYKYWLGVLLYIAVKPRPHLSFVVNQNSRNCENPT